MLQDNPNSSEEVIISWEYQQGQLEDLQWKKNSSQLTMKEMMAAILKSKIRRTKEMEAWRSFKIVQMLMLTSLPSSQMI